MGLYQSNFRFSGPIPSVSAIEAEARRRLGSIRGLEGLSVEKQTIIVCSMLDPFTHPVLCAILQEMGGQEISPSDGTPVAQNIPSWARRPLSELTWSQRMSIRWPWWRWLFGSARIHDDVR